MTVGRYSNTEVNLQTVLRRQNKGIILAILLAIIVPTAIDYWRSRDIPVVSSVTINNLQLISKSELCPGEQLVFTYDLYFQGSGVLVRDLTVWNVDPPKTIIFSMARRFILPASITQQSLLETWTIPTYYHNFETDETEALPPGNYHRQIAISSATNEEVVDIDWIEFSIRKGC